MDDDFNTPQALAVLFDLLRLLYGSREQGAGAGAFVAGVARLVELARVLGLLEQGARTQPSVDPQRKAKIESLVYLREQARKQRDFAEADRLRDELVALNVTLKDSRDGTTWAISS
jgi:cysteinyl-tRNA synthetase